MSARRCPAVLGCAWWTVRHRTGRLRLQASIKAMLMADYAFTAEEVLVCLRGEATAKQVAGALGALLACGSVVSVGGRGPRRRFRGAAQAGKVEVCA